MTSLVEPYPFIELIHPVKRYGLTQDVIEGPHCMKQNYILCGPSMMSWEMYMYLPFWKILYLYCHTAVAT